MVDKLGIEPDRGWWLRVCGKGAAFSFAMAGVGAVLLASAYGLGHRACA